MKKAGETRDSYFCLVIDPDLVALIPPLTPGELGTLTDNIRRDGILNPITVWVRPKNANTAAARHDDCDLVIVDGHNRYKIAQELEIFFEISEMRFDTIEHAKLWMCDNQLGRRNLTPETRRNLIGQQVSLRKQTRGKKGLKDEAAPHTAEIVSAEYGISPRSAKDAKVYADGIAVIRTVDSNLADKILSGKSSYTSVDVMYAARLDKRTLPAHIELLSFVRELLNVKADNKHLSLETAVQIFEMDLPIMVIERLQRGESKAKINDVVTNLSLIAASLLEQDTYVALAIDYYFAKDCMFPLEPFFQMACMLPTFPSSAESGVVKNPEVLEELRKKWFAFYDFFRKVKTGTNKSPMRILRDTAFEMVYKNGREAILTSTDVLIIAGGDRVVFEDVTVDDMKQHLVYIQDCLASQYEHVSSSPNEKPVEQAVEQVVEQVVEQAEKNAKVRKKDKTTKPTKELPYSPIPRNALDALLSVLEKTNQGFSKKLSEIVVNNATCGAEELETFIEKALSSEEHAVVVDELTENADLAEIEDHIFALENSIKQAEEELAKMRSLKERTQVDSTENLFLR